MYKRTQGGTILKTSSRRLDGEKKRRKKRVNKKEYYHVGKGNGRSSASRAYDSAWTKLNFLHFHGLFNQLVHTDQWI